MQENFERFGIPDENIEAAQKWAKKHRKKYGYHTQVPTRKELLQQRDDGAETRKLLDMCRHHVHGP